MRDIAVYGAGGFGREIACLIKMINENEPTWNFIGFFDDGIEKNSTNQFGEILGGMTELNAWNKEIAIAIAIATPHTIRHIVENINNSRVYFPNIFAPDLLYLDESSVKFGIGNIICSRCLISCNVEIINFNIFNGYIPIGHNTIIGSYNVFMPSVNISGGVEIGDYNFMGVSSVILQQIKVGSGVRIGAGSIVIRKTQDNNLYIGNPAVRVKL